MRKWDIVSPIFHVPVSSSMYTPFETKTNNVKQFNAYNSIRVSERRTL